MELFNIVKGIRHDVQSGMVDAPVHTLSFQQPEETFHRGIVRTIANRTHATDQVMALEGPLIIATGELTAAMRGLCMAVLLSGLQACATIVVPPNVEHGGVPVFLLDHGRHSSLVLPAPDHHVVRYAYGDWSYYARVETGPYRGSSALLWPTQGALGRRELPGPPTLAAVRQQVKVPVVHIFRLTVEAKKADKLRQRLHGIFEYNKSTLLYNHLYDLYFVHDPRPYDIAHDSNRQVADWLIDLGCRIRGGPPLFSNWKVERH